MTSSFRAAVVLELGILSELAGSFPASRALICLRRGDPAMDRALQSAWTRGVTIAEACDALIDEALSRPDLRTSA